ncbi:hypothetical protein [Neobacillus terrae]|uniref:hypothetical protein n=1 Tax=Neobacillus terrae TaxID=3034837 RepID=UPI00140B90BC|nr:hypothetical protein [Neobacillus terrae]NHM30972.1 hypothetical protein [Neobacillus terrae]
MKILINGRVYNSAMTPIVLEFEDQEAHVLGLAVKRIVTTPKYMTQDEAMDLAEVNMEFDYMEVTLEPKRRKGDHYL